MLVVWMAAAGTLYELKPYEGGFMNSGDRDSGVNPGTVPCTWTFRFDSHQDDYRYWRRRHDKHCDTVPLLSP